MTYSILMIVIGLLLCFLGMRLNKAAAFLVGVASGSYLAYLIMHRFLSLDLAGMTYTHLAILCVAGLVGSGMAYRFEKLVICLGVWLASGYLVYAGTVVISSIDSGSLPAAAIAGLVVAAVVFVLYDTMMVLATSLIGGILISGAALELIHASGKLPNLDPRGSVFPIAALVLMFLGILKQKK